MPTSTHDGEYHRRLEILEEKVILGNGTDSLLVRMSKLEKWMGDTANGQQSLLLQTYALDKTLQTFMAVTEEKAKQAAAHNRQSTWVKRALIAGLIALVSSLVDHASFSWHIH